jgi:hypothetical protein
MNILHTSRKLPTEVGRPAGEKAKKTVRKPDRGKFLPIPLPPTLRIGWLSWKQLRKILESTQAQFRTHAKAKFIEDLIVNHPPLQNLKP